LLLGESNRRWYRIIDTAQPAPKDLHNPENAPMIAESTDLVMARSSFVLMAGPS
jgi:hypothetical protein